MKKQVEIKRVENSKRVCIYTFQFQNQTQSEFEDFLIRYKDSTDRLLKDDFDRIIKMISKILEYGALERLFRVNESKMQDHVVSIPLDILPRKNHDTLRLYCIRISSEILIIGNGGTKRRKYNDNKITLSHVQNLAKLEKAINCHINKGEITINGKDLIIGNNTIIKI